jgi:hypothetical protein
MKALNSSSLVITEKPGARRLDFACADEAVFRMDKAVLLITP